MFFSKSSLSSDEDDSTNRQREFQTSFEEESTPSPHKAALYITASPNTLSQVTGKGDGDSDNKMEITSQLSSSNKRVHCFVHLFYFHAFYSSTIMADSFQSGGPIWSDTNGHSSWPS